MFPGSLCQHSAVFACLLPRIKHSMGLDFHTGTICKLCELMQRATMPIMPAHSFFDFNFFHLHAHYYPEEALGTRIGRTVACPNNLVTRPCDSERRIGPQNRHFRNLL